MGAAEELDLEDLRLDIVPERIEIDREIASRGVAPFVRVAWSRVEQASAYQHNWHADVIAEHLEAVSRNEIRKLIFNVPPGTGKSSWVSVFWPTWEWIEIDPTFRDIFVTYSDRLSRRDAIRMRDLVQSPWFQARWPDVSIPSQNTRSAKLFRNSAGGFRFSTTVRGGLTGEHGHRLVIDDPIKPAETIGSRAALGTELDNVIDWWTQTASSRGGVDPKRFAQVVIMQRLHQRDLVGYLEEKERNQGWTIVKLPMRFEPERAYSSPYGSDPREDEGELLWPERFDEEAVVTLEERLGPRGTAAQLQQRPTPEGGLTFEKSWFRYWGTPTSPFPELPVRRAEIQIWDMTFKGKPKAGKRRSFVCGQVWARAGKDLFLLGMEHGQWSFVQQQKALLRLTGAFPKAHRKYVEDAANGAAIVDQMKGKVSGLKLVGTGGGSEPRAEAASISFESGNVWFPDPSFAPWVKVVEDELLAFPMGRHDDIVDCVSHAVVILAEAANASYAQAMSNVRERGGIVS